MFKVKRYNSRHGFDAFGKIIGDFATMDSAKKFLEKRGCKDFHEVGNSGSIAANDPDDERWGSYIIYDWKKMLRIWKQNGINERYTATV